MNYSSTIYLKNIKDLEVNILAISVVYKVIDEKDEILHIEKS